jgi:flagella basal body P-ring formation protein FlgA
MKSLALSCLALLFAAPAAASDATPRVVTEALANALAVPGARIDVKAWKLSASGCTPESAEVERPIDGSGRYGVKVSGPGCGLATKLPRTTTPGVWGWATVNVFAPVLVTTRSVRSGEALAGAVKELEKEVRPGRVPARFEELGTAKAARPLAAGQLLEAAHVEVLGPVAGSPIRVVVRAGALAITQTGRVVPCGRGRTCAVLPSGKHVEGSMANDTLVVELP